MRHIFNDVIKKVEIFKEKEHPEIESQADEQKSFSSFLTIGCLHAESKRVVDHRAYKNEREKSPIPPAVKNITRQQKEQISSK